MSFLAGLAHLGVSGDSFQSFTRIQSLGQILCTVKSRGRVCASQPPAKEVWLEAVSCQHSLHLVGGYLGKAFWIAAQRTICLPMSLLGFALIWATAKGSSLAQGKQVSITSFRKRFFIFPFFPTTLPELWGYQRVFKSNCIPNAVMIPLNTFPLNWVPLSKFIVYFIPYLGMICSRNIFVTEPEVARG